MSGAGTRACASLLHPDTAPTPTGRSPGLESASAVAPRGGIMIESKGGQMMEIRRGGRGALVIVGVACLAMSGSQTARAQVKLEYKFPEGKKLTYKTNLESCPRP